MADINNPQRVCLAASTLGDEFHIGEIVVASWQMYPTLFCLDGFEQYPDSNKVAAMLMGAKGLVERGMFERTRSKTYRLTPAGREAAEVAASGVKKYVESASVAGEDEQRLLQLLSSAAYTRFAGGVKDGITIEQARCFLELQPTKAIAAARRSTASGKIRLANGTIKASQLDSLEACRAHVERIFAKRPKLLASTN